MTAKRRPKRGASIGHRLRAWWSGGPAGDEPTVLDFTTKAKAPPAKPRRRSSVDFSGPPSLKSWSPARLTVVQDIFGTGHTVPASAETLSDFLAPLDLRKGSLVADVGARLGALSSLLRTAGCRVVAYEPDKALAALWNRTTGQLPGPPCEVQPYVLDRIDFGTQRFDYMVSKEGLLTVTNKPRLLERMRSAMSHGGVVVLSDFVRTGTEAGIVYKHWRVREPVPPQLLTLPQWESALSDARFEIVSADDISAQIRRDALRSFDRYARDIKAMAQNLEVGRLDWVLAEGEHWALRLGVLEAGAVRVMRFHCRTREAFG